MTDATEQKTKLVREQSTVQFPYEDFESAVAIAQAIHDAGGPTAKDQLAARMGQNLTGAFSAKVSAARMFGLILHEQGTYKVSTLGYEVIDGAPNLKRTARAKAFLKVELYRTLFEEYRGKPLPPRPGGLEDAMVRLGVAAKQKTNARYAFDRSAKQAGFFEHGNDRLVEPVTGFDNGADASAHPVVPDTSMQKPATLEAQTTEGLDVVIAALVAKLPRGADNWTADERGAWLKMMSMAFDMAYGAPSAQASARRPPAAVGQTEGSADAEQEPQEAA